jgi:hypothetical protein
MAKGCSGAPHCGHQLCECTPAGGVDLAEWNAGHSRRWNWLRTNLRRAYPQLEYWRGIEVQMRGALHDHALLWSPVPLSLRVVRRLAIRAGFGHSVDLAPCEAGSKRAASYASKRVAGYVTKATDSRTEVPWLPAGTIDDGDVLIEETTGEVLRRSPQTYGAPYRTWSCSRGWGLSMAAVHAECAAYAREKRQQQQDQLTDLLARELGAVVITDETPPPPS